MADYTQVKKELVHTSRMVHAMGYTQASGGNVSCRVPNTPFFAIKRTGVTMRDMGIEDALILDENGEVVDGTGTPSKETGFHIGIMKARGDVNAVVHCHPDYAIAFANCGMELPHTSCTSRKVAGRVRCIGYEPPGSDALRDMVTASFRDPQARGLLMDQHGVCAVGDSLQSAFNVAEVIEQTAKQAILMLTISQNKDFFINLKP